MIYKPAVLVTYIYRLLILLEEVHLVRRKNLKDVKQNKSIFIHKVILVLKKEYGYSLVLKVRV